jgi:hypothetical protein
MAGWQAGRLLPLSNGPVQSQCSGYPSGRQIPVRGRRQPFVSFSHSGGPACGAGGGSAGFLVAALVLSPAQRAVMVRVALGEVLGEPLIAAHVSCSQAALLFCIQSAEIRTRCVGLFHGAVFLCAIRAHHVVSMALVLASSRRGIRRIHPGGFRRRVEVIAIAGIARRRVLRRARLC